MGESQLTWLTALRRLLFRPVDGASLGAFRVAFGLIGVGQAVYLVASGWVARHWLAPAFHFHYPGFHWVEPWPGPGLYLHIAAMAVCAACVALGVAYRVAAVGYALGFTYLFLLEGAEFENHNYLFACLCWILAVAPAQRVFALGARRRGGGETIPFWPVLLLRAQWAVVFFHGSVSKWNADWLRAWPLQLWLPDAPHVPPLGLFFDEVWMAYLWSYTGIVFDLAIVPLLLYRPTRDFAFVALCMFFATAYLVLGVGFFATIGVTSATLFYPPDWPRRVLGLRAARTSEPAPGLGARGRAWASAAIATYLLLQLLLPLRHWLYPGDASWTDEGHEFAWRMMLRDKRAEVRFRVTDPATGESFEVDPRRWLSERQHWRMACRPELIRQFAHHLSRQHGGAAVHAESSCALNGRRPQPLVDPAVDLAAEPYRLGPAPWIVPLREPLRARSEVLAQPRAPAYPPP